MMRKVLVLMVGAAVASACGGTEPDRPVEDIPSMESQAAAEPTAMRRRVVERWAAEGTWVH